MDKARNNIIRLTASVPICLNLKLENKASRLFLFRKGYKRDAIVEAIKFWIWIVNNDSELYEQLKGHVKNSWE